MFRRRKPESEPTDPNDPPAEDLDLGSAAIEGESPELIDQLNSAVAALDYGTDGIDGPDGSDGSDGVEISADLEAADPDAAYDMAYDAPALASEPIPSADLAAPARPRRTPIRRLPFAVRPGILFVVIAVIVIGIALLLQLNGGLPEAVILYYPLAVLIPGAGWVLSALVRRDGRGLLAGAALFGAGTSLMLGTLANVPVGSTLVGIVLISCGTSILLRGLLFGREPVLTR